MDTPQHRSEFRTILVIDDTPFNLTLMSAVLRKHYHVKEASSGQQALDMLQSAPGRT